MLDLPADFEDDTASLPEPVQVTTGDADCVDVTWRPDGGELAFVSARHPRADRDLVRDVYAIAPDGSGLRQVTDSWGDCALPAYDPTGRTLYVTAVPDLGPDGVDFVARQAVPCRVDADGGPLEPLLDPAQHHRGDETPATVVADGGVLRRRAARGRGGAAAGAARRGRARGAGRRGVHGARLRGRRRCRRRRRRP